MTVDPSISHLPGEGSSPDHTPQRVSASASQSSVKAALSVAAAFALATIGLIAGTASAEDSSVGDPSPLAGTQIATVDLSTAANLTAEQSLSIARPAGQQRSLGSITEIKPASVANAVAHTSPVANTIATEEAPDSSTEAEEPAPQDMADTGVALSEEAATAVEAETTESPDEAAETTDTAETTETTQSAEATDEPAAAATESATESTDQPAETTETAETSETAETVGADGESEEPAAVVTRQISTETPLVTFPVVGPVNFVDTWGACRGAGCSRSHKGVDIFGHKLAPLVAAADGVITGDRRSAMSISGNTVIITGDDGWRYIYVHLNNDAPGTDDGSNPQAWIIPNRLRVGDRVEAGDVIGYLGDSGNAETTPAHLHFEIHKPGVGAINPTEMVAEAQAAGRVVGVPALASTPEGRAEHGPTVVAWYQALLKRDPTDIELFAWADRFDIGFANKNDLIADLTMDKARRDPAGAIVRSFWVALDRLPTLNELRLWEDAYRNGVDLEAVGKTLVESAPFEDEHGVLTDEQFVTVLYRNATGSGPSEQRLAEWLDELSNGTSRASVAAHLADSYTVKNSTWHGLEVIQSYRAGLDRMPTTEEYDRWVAHLDGGGLIPDVVEGIRGVD